MGPQGPAGPTGPQGPAGASSLDALIGTTCNIGSPDQGLLQVTYASDGSGSITFKCVPTTLHNLTVSVSGGDGFDTVTSSPAGIDCDNAMTTPTCSQPLPAGSTVTLTAQPDGGPQAFFGWNGGGCTGTALTCTVTIGGDTSVTASFAAPHMLTFSPSNYSSTGIYFVDAIPETPSQLAPGLGGFEVTPGLIGETVHIGPVPYGVVVDLRIETPLPNPLENIAWNGACAGHNLYDCLVTMTSDQTAGVQFQG